MTFLSPSWIAVVTGSGQRMLEEQVPMVAVVLRLMPVEIAMLPVILTVVLLLMVLPSGISLFMAQGLC